MRCIVAGSRSFRDYVLLRESLDRFQAEHYEITTVISGKAEGADMLGEQYARERSIPVSPYPARWDLYGKSAGPIRNKEMALAADCLVAFWDGESKGTSNMINVAKELGLKVYVIRVI